MEGRNRAEHAERDEHDEHDEIVALWDAAGPDPAWRERVTSLAPAARRLLLAVADARYVAGAEEAERSRTVYATLEADLDPTSPADAARVGHLFDGPMSVPWPMDLVRRAFRRSADRNVEIRAGLLHAQSLLLAGDVASAEAVCHAVLHRAPVREAGSEGVALLLLQRAAWLCARRIESLLLAAEAVRWAEAHGTDWWRALSWQYRVEVLVTMGAVAPARAALAAYRDRVEALSDERRSRSRTTVRGLEGVLLLFAGDPEAAIGAFRAARSAASETADPATSSGDLYFDAEIDALRRLGRLREAEAVLDRARQRAKTREAGVHVGALAAAIAATDGRPKDAARLFELLRSDPGSPLVPGLRLVALEHLLDACEDDAAFDGLARDAAPLLMEATAARVAEVARFDAAAADAPRRDADDLAILGRRLDPFARRDGRAWRALRAALEASEMFADTFRLHRGRPTRCGRCGRVETRRSGWLYVRSLLPHADVELATAAACERCQASPA